MRVESELSCRAMRCIERGLHLPRGCCLTTSDSSDELQPAAALVIHDTKIELCSCKSAEVTSSSAQGMLAHGQELAGQGWSKRCDRFAQHDRRAGHICKTTHTQARRPASRPAQAAQFVGHKTTTAHQLSTCNRLRSRAPQRAPCPTRRRPRSGDPACPPQAQHDRRAGHV